MRQLLVNRIIIEVASQIEHSFGQPININARQILITIHVEAVRELFPKRTVVSTGASYANDRKVFRQQSRPPEVIKRGHQQALRQIARRPEDHEHARRCRRRRGHHLFTFDSTRRQTCCSWWRAACRHEIASRRSTASLSPPTISQYPPSRPSHRHWCRSLYNGFPSPDSNSAPNC